VEDWYQTTIDVDAELTDRFELSTHRVLEALAGHGVRATFFVLGLAAEKSPQTVKAIAAGGHEVQSHGYGHRSNFELTGEQLRQDLLRAKGLIEDLCGQQVYGYRAPCFSIDGRNPWALDVLAETGHRYDSSIVPVRTRHYGIAGYPPGPHVVATPGGRRIVEVPVACFDLLGFRLPVGGGGYFRLWPYRIIRMAWRQFERRGRPGVVYMHPYEYDPHEMDTYAGKISFRQRLHQGLGRKRFPAKLDRLMREFRFGPICEVIAPLLEELNRSSP
jgi:polysaccharide deacetylase family protein (PEP-CTERM system associated)